MNYFELFDLPMSFEIDVNLLNMKYIVLQKQFHPDYFTQSDEAEQQDVLEKSSLLNKALQVLRTPDRLIPYVLQLMGTITDDEKFQLPPDFLMEMMELNEELSADSGKEIEAINQALEQEVKPLLASFDFNQPDEKILQRIKEYHFKKKYLQRILDRLKG